MKLLTFIFIFAIAFETVFTENIDLMKRLKSIKDDTPIALNDVIISNVEYDYFYNVSQSTIAGLTQPSQVQNLTDKIIISYDSLNVSGTYWTDGTLFYILPLFGDGSYQMQATNITVTATGQPGQYDMFFFVFDFQVFLQNYVGGGLMSLVADALKIPPIAADIIFKAFEPNIASILNSMIASNK